MPSSVPINLLPNSSNSLLIAFQESTELPYSGVLYYKTIEVVTVVF